MPTATLLGTLKDPLLLLNRTGVEFITVRLRVTVQVLDALLPNVEGAHASDVSCAAALAVRVKVWETPLTVAVNTEV